MTVARHILSTTFGYTSFRGTQEEIIEHVIAGGDALVVMPTGAGKSICYQIPAIARPGLALVVSPLIALMRDQVAALEQCGVRAAYLSSTLSLSEAAMIEAKMLAGDLDIVYAAPERAVTPAFLDLLARCPLALFAIDEAHCVSQWGHDFRPEYLGLAVLAERFAGVPRIAVTATADEATRKEIESKLRLSNAKIVVAGFDRPNIRYHVRLKANPRAQLEEFLSTRSVAECGIVYCLSRRKTEETARFLSERGHRCVPYHAGLDASTRERHQDLFLKEDGVIVAATIAFGMGIDKPDVRFVFHMDLPKSIEAYYQETGRAGRDGAPATACMLYGLGDVMTFKQMIDSSGADEEHKRLEHRKLTSLLGYCETTACRRQVLLSYFGESRSEPCGNCDTCLEPVDSMDGTRWAQMALSCVYRTGQRFGAGYLVDVLLGRSTDRIVRFGHDKLSTFGIGTELAEGQWFSVFRQLAAAGFLGSDPDGHGSLVLTPESRSVLTGGAGFRLRRDPTPVKRQRRKGGRDAKPGIEPADRGSPLFDALRAKRKELASQQGVPPYVIFHDRTLAEMAARKPRTKTELLEVTGVGESKLERYGEAFLEVIIHQETSIGS